MADGRWQVATPLRFALRHLPFAIDRYNSVFHVRLERHPQSPADRVSDEGESACRRAADARPLERDEPVWTAARSSRGEAQVRAPRRPPVRERQHSHRHGHQQDSQRAGGQIEIDVRLRRTVRRRVRLPWPAHRAESRQRARGQEARHERSRVLPRVPRLRRALHRHDDRTVPAAGHPRHLGRPLPDDGLSVSGGHRQDVRTLRREGARLQRQEAGALVHPLPHCARRSRGRVRRPRLAVDLRRVRAGAGEPGGDRAAGTEARRTERVGRHLDDDAVDDSVQPRDCLSPRV